MKQGLSIVELATELHRQQSTKKDIVASTEHMQVVVPYGTKATRLEIGKELDFGINDIGHKQIAAEVGIPAQYYNRMREEAPELLANNVNTWFRNQPKERMVRTLDGDARAFLSDKFRPLENSDLAEAVLPPLLELGVEVLSCNVTATKLYIKAVDKRILADVPSGRRIGDGSHVFFDTVSPAIVISNSEVGMGALSVETSIFTKVCTNLATIGQTVRKTHLGAKHEIADGLYGLLSDQTRRLTDAALWGQVRDVVKGAFEEARFRALVDEKLLGLSEQKIEGDPIKVVDLSAKRFGLTEGEKTSVLRHLIEGGDLSRYGLFNAVTRSAEDLDDYDRASDFEKLGGKIIELPRNEWQELARAA